MYIYERHPKTGKPLDSMMAGMKITCHCCKDALAPLCKWPGSGSPGWRCECARRLFRRAQLSENGGGVGMFVAQGNAQRREAVGVAEGQVRAGCAEEFDDVVLPGLGGDVQGSVVGGAGSTRRPADDHGGSAQDIDIGF